MASITCPSTPTISTISVSASTAISTNFSAFQWDCRRARRSLQNSLHFPIWAASHDKDIDSDNLYFATIDSRVFDISVFRDDADITQIGSSHFYIWCLMDSYVDDIFGLASSETLSLRQWSHSEKIFSAMNLSCKVAKGKLPAQVNVFLGKEYDLRRQWVRLSDGKLAKYIHFYT